MGRPMALAIALTGLAFRLVHVDDAEVMLGMLQIILGGDSIAGRGGIARELEIFFINLIGITPNPNLGTIAVESLQPKREVGLSSMTTVTAMATVTAAIATATHSFGMRT